MVSESRWPAGHHPAPAELLLAQEEQLPASQAKPILAHLSQCWECRTRADRYTRGIELYLRFRQTQFSAAEPPEGGWLRFSARLRAEDGARPLPEPRRVWLAVPVAVAALLILVLLLAPPRLTATSVLDRAVRAETDSSIRDLVCRVTVRRNGRVMPAGIALLREAHIDPAHPLSAADFRDWHEALATPRDLLVSTNGEIRLETSTAEGPVAIARIRFAAGSYQTLARHVEMRDGSVIDVSPGNPDPVPSAPPAPAPPTLPPADTGTAAREILELEVRQALYRIEADLGEPLSIQASATGILVSGTLDDAARREQVVNALNTLPDVSVRIDLAAARPDLLANAQPIAPAAPSAVPLLASRLADDFPATARRSEFVSGALHASRDILRHAWALRRLALRYPAAETLPPEARRTLDELVRSHQDAIHLAAHQAAALWTPYIQLAAGAGTQFAWQSSTVEWLRAAQSFDHLSARLVAAGGDDVLSAPAALRQLAEAARRLP